MRLRGGADDAVRDETLLRLVGADRGVCRGTEDAVGRRRAARRGKRLLEGAYVLAPHVRLLETQERSSEPIAEAITGAPAPSAAASIATPRIVNGRARPHRLPSISFLISSLR